MDFFQDHQSKLATIIVCENFIDSNIDEFISLETMHIVKATVTQVERMVYFASKVFNLNFKTSQSKISNRYIQIGTSLIYEYKIIPIELFIRISTGHKQYKYIKIVNNNTKLEESLFEKYQDQPMFIDAKDYAVIFDKFLEKDNKKSIEDELLETSFLVDLIPYYIYEYGQEDTKIQTVTNKIVENCVSLCQKRSETQKVFEDIFKNKLSVRFQNCFLKILFMYQILERRRDLKKANLEKVILSSIFSDISLAEESYLSITNENSDFFKELDDDTKEKIYNHALTSYQDSGKILKKVSQHKIGESVLHHNGSLDGKGFYQNDLSDFNEFDQAFIIISFYVASYFKDGEPITTKTAFSYLKKQFPNEDLKEYECLI